MIDGFDIKWDWNQFFRVECVVDFMRSIWFMVVGRILEDLLHGIGGLFSAFSRIFFKKKIIEI